MNEHFNMLMYLQYIYIYPYIYMYDINNVYISTRPIYLHMYMYTCIAQALPVTNAPVQEVDLEPEEAEDVGLSRADEMSPRKVPFRGVEENSKPLEGPHCEPLDTS